MNVTIGADPEFFVRPLGMIPKVNKYGQAMKNVVAQSRPEWVPICGQLGGTKKEPLQIPGLPKGYLQQEDGAAVEFNIPPCTDAAEFSKSIGRATSTLISALNKKQLDIIRHNSVLLTPEILTKFPNLAGVGCDPDYSAYEDIGQPRKPLPSSLSMVRGAGGHIHIGYDKTAIPENVLVRLLDLCVCLPFLRYDHQGERRKWWGLPGIHRPKPYGVEYRTLSNFWLFDSTVTYNIASTVFELIESLMRNVIEWQALYNVVNWEGMGNLIKMEDGDAALKMLSGLMENNKVLSLLINDQRLRF